MAVETVSGIAFLAGRVPFGGALAFTGRSHRLRVDELTDYAEAKGTPATGLSVKDKAAHVAAGLPIGPLSASARSRSSAPRWSCGRSAAGRGRIWFRAGNPDPLRPMNPCPSQH